MTAPPMIIDTDFGFFTSDGLAVLTALGMPEIDVLGICVVAGDNRLNQQVEDALRVLELVGRADVPVHAGFDRPLVHERDPEDDRWGLWATEGEVAPRAGQPAIKQVSSTHASDFIIEQANARPGEVTLLTLGPLTNVAVALRKDPLLASKLRRIVMMGGAIPCLPRGHGGHTTTAEFNFWVDPEAARIVLRSGAKISLAPLNATRPVRLTQALMSRIGGFDTYGSKLLQSYVGPVLDEPSEWGLGMTEYGLTDTTAFIFAVAPELFKTVRLYVDVDTAEGLGYGTSHGYLIGTVIEAVLADAPWAWTGLTQPRHLLPNRSGSDIEVAYEVDAEAVIDRFVDAINMHVAPPSS